MLKILHHRPGDAIQHMIVLARVMPGDLVAVARHLHENAAAHILDEMLIVRKVHDGTDGFRAEPETHAHRAGWQRVFRQPTGELDGTHHAGAVIVGLHRVTGVCLNNDLSRRWNWSALWMNDGCRDL